MQRLQPLPVAVATAAFAAMSSGVQAQPADLTGMSLESLLETRVSSASKYEQAGTDVPATVRVITRSEIQAFGWRSLGEVLSSLP
ncbi:MAG: TonB-dependent receptor, partial [Pseudomonadota bacterium]